MILRSNGKTEFLMWISSYCVACIYHTTVRLFSLLTYEDGNSPAMKHIKHISGVRKLVEGIHIIQNKQQCQTTEYVIYNLFAVLVKLVKMKGKIW